MVKLHGPHPLSAHRSTKGGEGVPRIAFRELSRALWPGAPYKKGVRGGVRAMVELIRALSVR